MEDISIVKHGEEESTSSSIESAVQELLSITNAAVKKLTEPQPRNTLMLDTSSESLQQPIKPASAEKRKDEEYVKDKRLLELLSETPGIKHDESMAASGDESTDGAATSKLKQTGKVVDITHVLEELPRSEISILDVGGGQPDSSISTPSMARENINYQAEDSLPRIAQSVPVPQMFKDSSSVGLPGDSILSPIVVETDAGHLEEEEEQSFTISVPKINSDGKRNLTSSLKSSSESKPGDESENSSSASEVLRNSTRPPKIPDSARLKDPEKKHQVQKRKSPEKANDEFSLKPVVHKKDVSKSSPSARVIIKKSNHSPEQPIERSSQPSQSQFSQQKVRIPKKKMREVKLPVTVDIQHTNAPKLEIKERKFAPYAQPQTLSQGVVGIEEDKENEDIDSALKIIRGEHSVAKKKLLGARKTGNPSKRVVSANVVDEKTMQKKMAQNHLSASMMNAFTTAPMLRVQQNLESQVLRLTEKLDELEKQKEKEKTLKHQEHAANLERKLEELTSQRLKSLEQLQEQQAAWQSHLLRVVGNMQNTQKEFTGAATEKAAYAPPRTVRFGGVTDSPDVLQTPAPRTQAPYPISSKVREKGTSPGNGYLLKNILEQMEVSTPGPSPAVTQLPKASRDPLTELTPVRGPTKSQAP